MDSTASAENGLLICRDLVFVSKITGTANALGFQIDVVETVPQAAARLAEKRYGCVLVDLSIDGLQPSEVISVLPEQSPPAVLAFGSHVDPALLQSAAEAGCRAALPRSRFSSSLPQILREYLSFVGEEPSR
jgi:DNA-binding NarL/FixJ family response regulator